VGDIGVTYISKLKMPCSEFSSDNNFYMKSLKLIVLFHFENRQGFLPHSVYKCNINLGRNSLRIFEFFF
jgi:hypothetical protein